MTNEPTCELCGFPLSSRTHAEGLGSIHVRQPSGPAVAGGGEVSSLSDLTNRELITILERQGLPLPKPLNKANLIAVLEGA